MESRRWGVARDVVNIVKGRNALRTPHRDGQSEDSYERGIQQPRKDKPRPPAPRPVPQHPSAPRPAPPHSNSAPSSHHYPAETSPGGYAGPGQQWPPPHAAQDSYPSYQDPNQSPQGYSSGQNTYRPSHNGYQAPVQQSQYQQQHNSNPLHYQNTNQYGQSSLPRPEPDSGYPGYYTHTAMNTGVQNQDPQSNFYDPTSYGQGQAYPQYPQSSSSDPRSFGGAATVPPDNAGHYGGTDYHGLTDEQRRANDARDDNRWANQRDYNNQPYHNGGSNDRSYYQPDQWSGQRRGYN